ncbi:lipopolysaccharide heptosyltransferase I [Pseudomonas sp. FEN]|uniref:lipopolysaccharide heptosyltransferase I n=1 Tax=Pseudomonas sp. FEN TaxID=2767468 RepID=UPI00174E004F|nr:lipopolysaccharide heptosyltransferase I [Pseudomonas sp. FEN]
MNVLVVKLTSMGDLVHALPAITDAVNAIPGIQFDWVVDEAFAEIAKLHPAVNTLITTAHRRWRRDLWKSIKTGELSALWKHVRAKKYDVVIDAQNNLKSAIVMSFTRGLRCGMDRHSAREKFAHLVCHKTFTIPLKQHAIARQRQLFAKALGYTVPDSLPDFSIDQQQLPALPIALPSPYLVFVHSTTWDAKHWPERYWQQLIKIAVQAGYHVVLPWGNANEQARANRLAEASSGTTVLPRLSITQQAAMISRSAGAICVDTGLGHVAAALDKPAVHLYGATDPALIGATGLHQRHLLAEFECVPCYRQKCKIAAESACFVQSMQPEKVWAQFLAQLDVVPAPKMILQS